MSQTGTGDKRGCRFMGICAWYGSNPTYCSTVPYLCLLYQRGSSIPDVDNIIAKIKEGDINEKDSSNRV